MDDREDFEAAVKADVVPVVASLAGVEPRSLKSLPLALLQRLFEALSSGVVSRELVAGEVAAAEEGGELGAVLERRLSSLLGGRPAAEGAGAGAGAAGAWAGDDALLVDLRAAVLSLVASSRPGLADEARAALERVTDVGRLNRMCVLTADDALRELGVVVPEAGGWLPAPEREAAGVGSDAGASGGESTGRGAAAGTGERDARATAALDVLAATLRSNGLADRVDRLLEALRDCHPDDLERLERVVKRLARRDWARLAAFVDYVAATALIERVDVNVEHWQGVKVRAGMAVGGYEAAIPFRRFDKFVAEMDAARIEQFARTAEAAMEKLRSGDLATFQEGAKEAKRLAFVVQKEVIGR
ncbi:MAG: hypothetical protein Kow0069_14620 [Promethearchaeota archaeon]